MSAPRPSSSVELFRAMVAGRMGLQFADAKLPFLGAVLERRLHITKIDAATYLAGLEASASAEELGCLAEELTVGETSFFRYPEQMRAFAEVALPVRRSANAGRRQTRVLSAGCASGEEPYSLAICVREGAPGRGEWGVSIDGVDLNRDALQKAELARFSSWSLRETAPAVRGGWFRPDGAAFRLDEAIRTMVTFRPSNLAEDDPGLWQDETYDIIFCRNVLIYFTEESAHRLIGRIARALVPGGYLFLGHAETLRRLSDDFHPRHTHGTFYYERKAAARGSARARPPAVGEVNGPDLAEVVECAGSWVDAIGRTAGRVRALAALQEREPEPPARPQPATLRGWDLAIPIELLRRERFSEALALVEDLPAESARDPDVLLLQAVLLTHSGQIARAREVCSALLALDEMNAGAYYLLALCAESAGDAASAAECDRTAIFLDPAFAMPRMHAGLLAVRAGDVEAARLSLSAAKRLFAREDPSRLLLFGGGFGREALTEFCSGGLAPGRVPA